MSDPGAPLVQVRTTIWDSLELPAARVRPLVRRQAAWVGLSTLVLAVSAALRFAPEDPLVFGIAVAAGVAASRPTGWSLLPVVFTMVVTLTLALAWLGLPVPVAAGSAAGLAVGSGSRLSRVQAVLFGVMGMSAAWWIWAIIAERAGAMGPLAHVVAATLLGTKTALLGAQALLPGELVASVRSHIVSLRVQRATLRPPYLPACAVAFTLDRQLRDLAPDARTRAGLAEVAGWVYRLSLTLQALDHDVAQIDPVAIARRRAALTGPAGDPFVAERRRSTLTHLDRMEVHRQQLVVERERTLALQEDALAYLQEARCGLAVARVLPGEDRPDGVGAVLEKLRKHATDREDRRRALREVGVE